MKRFHVHVHVDDLAQSIRFYSTLFAGAPSVVKPDYAKWMLEDPRVNFAISTRAGAPSGIAHLGIQAEDQAELAEIHDRLSRAERPVLAETAATCCYAVSDKEWVDDPQGVRWETFWTYGEATVYGRSTAVMLDDAADDAGACCAPTCCAPEAVAEAAPQPAAAPACCAR